MKKKHSLLLLYVLIFIGCNQKKEKNTADRLYEEGVELYYKRDYDSSFKKFYKSSQEYLKHELNRDAAMSLIFSSMIQNEKGDYLGSNDNAAKAAKLLDKNDENFVSVYNQFARNHEELKNYKEAIYFYNKAMSYSHDEHALLVLKNNIAIVNLKIKNYPESIKIFSDAIKSNLIKDSIDLGNKILDNYAYAKFLSNPKYNPEKELTSILAKKLERKDFSGANASFSHLSDYFVKRDDAKSLYYAKEMYNNAKKTGSRDDQLDALRKIIRVEENDSLKVFFDKYQALNDSIQALNNNSKSQFASVIYDSEKNKTDALTSNNKLQKQYFLSVFLVLSIIIIIILYRKRQTKLKQQKQLEVKNTELKYSKKVHDVVANGLYHMMTDIQNNPNVDKVNILNNIEKMYEESRDISHENAIETDFYKRFEKMIGSYNSADQKVLPVGYHENVWDNLSHNTCLEIYYIIRELLVNMKKHSQAKLVVLKFEKETKLLKIKYTDNGVGIDDLENNKGTGILNTENRIEMMGGDITFDKNPKGGLIIQLIIPTK